MASFGQQLMRERERRGLPRARVAEATEIYIHDLAALEFGDFDALPETPVVEGFVRTYAEYLGVDVEAIVADFHRSRPVRETLALQPAVHAPAEDPLPVEAVPGPIVEESSAQDLAISADSGPESIAEPVEPAAPQTEPLPQPMPAPDLAERPPWPEEDQDPPLKRPGRIRWLPLVVVAGSLTLVAIWWGLVTGQPVVDPPPAVSTDPRPAAPDRSVPVAATVEPKPVVEPEQPSPEPAAGASLRVSEHGVGTDVVDRRLIGEADRFAAGSRVWFWTRVRGGAAGSEVRHVWIHDGRVVERITLQIGSPNWRTQSAKKIYREGRWAVEARDPSGNVLARSEFDCVP